MSSFLVSDNTMHRAVAAFNDGQDCRYLDDLGRRLFAMNCDALVARYPKEPRCDRSDYSWRVTFPESMEMLKALQCLIYQCAEGDVPEKNPLFKQCQDRERQLLHEIVSALPEYKALPWNWPEGRAA